MYPNCGHKGTVGGGSREGQRMDTEQSLLNRAAQARSSQEAAQLVAQANAARDEKIAVEAAGRETDLANAIIQDHMTPAPVHEMHTAATDWLGGVDVSGGANVEQEMIAQGSLWYGKIANIKPWRDEFEEQARGQARRIAGAYGMQAPMAEHTFLTHVGSLYERELRDGVFTEAASTVPQVGEAGNPEVGGTVGPSVPSGLPGEATSSERAPIMQAMEHNTSSGIHDALMPNTAEADNTGSERVRTQGSRRAPEKERNSMQQTANCPTCSGRGRVAVRTQAASGLDQIDQTVDPHDNPKATQYPTDVAFPWEMPGDSSQAIAETEQQLAQREQLKGASRQQRAEMAAHAAYRQVMAGQDDSGWLGDMGAGGVAPGEQDGGNPGPPSNLGQPDPVYGYGGDQGDRPMKPYGADEANDATNNPGMGWQPGQPTQYDQAGRGLQVGQPTASRRIEDDPQMQQALRYVRARREHLTQQGYR
jgi:hypothetical protein